MRETTETAAGGWHVAEINIARARAPLTDPMMADFVAALDAVNRAADESEGFVWRLKADDGGASSYVRFEDDERIIVNMSVWTSVEALRNYAYRLLHLEVFRERNRWCERMDAPHLALWWVAAGHIPTVDEGRERLARVTTSGPTREAFTFSRVFPPPEDRCR